MRLAYDSSDAGTGGAADNGSFEAVTEECPEYGSARSPDEGSLARTDTALVAVTVVVPAVVVVLTVVVSAVVVVGVVVLPTSAAAANAAVERLVASVIAMVAIIPVLRTSGKDAGG
jgi:hypothetical protein